MKEIKLYNRDGADLKLVQKQLKEIEPHITEWELQVDDKHKYVLEFVRFIGNYDEDKNSLFTTCKVGCCITNEMC